MHSTQHTWTVRVLNLNQSGSEERNEHTCKDTTRNMAFPNASTPQFENLKETSRGYQNYSIQNKIVFTMLQTLKAWPHVQTQSYEETKHRNVTREHVLNP